MYVLRSSIKLLVLVPLNIHCCMYVTCGKLEVE